MLRFYEELSQSPSLLSLPLLFALLAAPPAHVIKWRGNQSEHIAVCCCRYRCWWQVLNLKSKAKPKAMGKENNNNNNDDDT